MQLLSNSIQRTLLETQKKWTHINITTLAETIHSLTIEQDVTRAHNTLMRFVNAEPSIEYAYIIDFSGRPFAHTFDRGFPRAFADTHDHSASGQHASRYTIEGRSIFDYMAPLIDGLDAHIHVGVNQDEINAFTQSFIRSVVISLTLTMTAISFTIFFITRRFGRPLEALTAHIAEHQHSNELKPLNIPNVRGEVAELQKVFNDLTRSRNAMDQKLKRSNEDLEQKIRERTSSLEKARNEAIEASNAKSQFLSSMSHELRTPMNAILGFSQLLKLNDNNLNVTQRENVDEIISAGTHLITLIDEVLDLSKIESGRIKMSIETIDLEDVITETIKLIQPMANSRQITLEVNTEDFHDTQLKADYIRTKQILLNLLTNAIKYNHPHGSVKLYLSPPAQQQLVRISVQDTGPGIPETEHDRIFCPFERLATDEYSSEGTGIGLTISRKLAALMGGNVDYNSIPEQGSVFWVELPLAHQRIEFQPPSPQPETETRPVTTERARYTVLYVEDNPANLRLMQQILSERKNVKLITAPTARLGLDLAISHLPDLILLDIDLPDINGNELLNLLRKNTRLEDIPAIAVSAYAMEHEIRQSLGAGFQNYVTKPIDIPAFNQLIDKLLQEKSNKDSETILDSGTTK